MFPKIRFLGTYAVKTKSFPQDYRQQNEKSVRAPMERRTVSGGHKKGIPEGMPWKEKVSGFN